VFLGLKVVIEEILKKKCENYCIYNYGFTAMKDNISWQYDEFQQVGTDYGSKIEVEIYDY
jgi:hypothetical protein